MHHYSLMSYPLYLPPPCPSPPRNTWMCSSPHGMEIAVQMKWPVLAAPCQRGRIFQPLVQSGPEYSSYILENPEYAKRTVSNGQFKCELANDSGYPLDFLRTQNRKECGRSPGRAWGPVSSDTAGSTRKHRRKC